MKKLQLWLAARRHNTTRTWKRRVTKVRGWWRGWWIVMVGGLGAISVITISLSSVTHERSPDLWLNLIAELAGLFASLAVTYWLIDRKFSEQARRVEQNANNSLKSARSRLSMVVSNITSYLYKWPTDDRGTGGGPKWAKANHDLNQIFFFEVNHRIINPFDSATYDRVPKSLRFAQPWNWIWDGIIGGTDELRYVMQLFGTSLLEHEDLLRHIHSYESIVASERQAWLAFSQEVQRRNLRGDDEALPYEAVANMHQIAMQAVRVITAISQVTGDWGQVTDRGPDPRFAPTIRYGWDPRR